MYRPQLFFRRILRSEALVYKSYFFQNSCSTYNHRNFSRVYLLVKMRRKPWQGLFSAKLGEHVTLWFTLTLPSLKWLTEQKNPKSLLSLQNAQRDTTNFAVILFVTLRTEVSFQFYSGKVLSICGIVFVTVIGVLRSVTLTSKVHKWHDRLCKCCLPCRNWKETSVRK